MIRTQVKIIVGVIALVLSNKLFAQIGFEYQELIPVMPDEWEIVGTVLDDFNNDGRLDAVYVSQFGNQTNPKALYIYSFLQSDSGTFIPWDTVQYPTNHPRYSYIRAVRSGDVTGDGLADLLVATSDSNGIFLFEQDSLHHLRLTETIPLSDVPINVSVAPIYDETVLNIVVCEGVYTSSPRDFLVLTKNDSGGWNRDYFDGFDHQNIKSDFAFGDFNSDGLMDIANIGHGIDSNVTVVDVNYQTAEQTFEEWVTLKSDLPRQQVRSSAAGDFNSDGRADLAIVTAGSAPYSNLVVWYQTNNGMLDSCVSVSSDYGLFTLTAGHFSCGDTGDDLIMPHIYHITTFEQSGGILDSVYDIVTSPACNRGILHLGIDYGDINGDGLDDISLAGGDLAAIGINVSQYLFTIYPVDSFQIIDSTQLVLDTAFVHELVSHPPFENDTMIVFVKDSIITQNILMLEETFSTEYLIQEKNQCELISVDTLYNGLVTAIDTLQRFSQFSVVSVSDTVFKEITEAQFDFFLYPNPTYSSLSIGSSNLPNGTTEMTILDATGRIIESRSVLGKFDLQLEPGTYLLLFPEFSKTCRVVVL